MNICECKTWARELNETLISNHHPDCKNRNIELEAKNIIKALIKAIEYEASMGDGIDEYYYNAYYNARFFIGDKNTKGRYKDNINIHSCWCISNEKNFNALIKSGAKAHFKFNKDFKHLSVNSHGDIWGSHVHGKREIILVDNEWEYVN